MRFLHQLHQLIDPFSQRVSPLFRSISPIHAVQSPKQFADVLQTILTQTLLSKGLEDLVHGKRRAVLELPVQVIHGRLERPIDLLLKELGQQDDVPRLSTTEKQSLYGCGGGVGGGFPVPDFTLPSASRNVTTEFRQMAFQSASAAKTMPA